MWLVNCYVVGTIQWGGQWGGGGKVLCGGVGTILCNGYVVITLCRNLFDFYLFVFNVYP